MAAGVQQLLRSFDALSEAEKQEAAAEVLRRIVPEEPPIRSAEASAPKVDGRDAVKEWPIQPRNEWERRLLAIATDCGTSLSDEALSSEGLYE